ncbi:uncharacterized protein LOC135212709 [Macrobrachium nipponense]|uniref:uncharacterized protein LOC135212709 n=1 Tax=Macrobrachium nipponense TaxID=159736 RepID=UPI0030C7B23D
MLLSLLPLTVAALLSPATSDHSDYPVRTTSNWNVTSFNLPDKDKVVLAAKQNHSGTTFRARVFHDGDDVYNATCSMAISRWDAVIISREWIEQPNYSDQCRGANFPETPQKPKSRSLLVMSDAPTDWQLFALPFKNSEIKRTSDGSAVSFDLPAREAVFILYHPEDRTKPHFELSLSVNNELIYLLNFTSRPNYEWNTVAIYEDWINPRLSSIPKFTIPMESRSLQGRRINVSSEVPIQWQMFYLPLEPENEVESTAEGEIKDCAFFCVLTIVISCLYVLTLIAAALYIYHLKASATRSQGTDTQEGQSEIERKKSGNYEEPIYENDGNNGEPANTNAGHYMEHMHKRHGNFQEPVFTNGEDEEEHIYEEVDTMQGQYSASIEHQICYTRVPKITQVGRGHQRTEVDTFGYMIPAHKPGNRDQRY